MQQEFLDRKARVVICDESAHVRSMISEQIKKIGFKDVQGVGSVKAALNLMEVENDKLNWFISSISLDTKITGLNLLDLFLKHASFRHVRSTFIINDSEGLFLIKAYELGLLSHFSSNFTAESLRGELRTLITTIESYKGDFVQTSASFLRPALEEHEMKRDLLSLATSMADLYPEKAESFFNLGKAQLMVGNYKLGHNSLVQARLIDKGLMEEIEHLINFYIPKEEINSIGQVTPAQAIGLNRCMVVDPDSQIQKLLWGVVTKIGVPKVDLYQEPEEAWENLKEKENIDLLIQEWKLPKIGGHGFLQRFRKQGFLGVPVILLTDSVRDHDLPLLKEMGISQVVKKPIEKPDLTRAIIAAMREEQFPTQKKVLLRKITASLVSGQAKKALGFQRKLMEMHNVTEAEKLHVDAEFAFFEEKYEEAKNLGMKALKLGGDSLLLLNLIGKSFMRLRDFNAALKCLNRAQAFSPANISRLCSIAEVQIETGATGEAEKTINKAKKIDESSLEVTQSEAKLALVQGDFSRVKDLVSAMEDITGIVSFLNTKAVALSLAGKHEEALSLYQDTIKILPKERTAECAAVWYNMALAATKQNQLDVASGFLEKSLAFNEGKIHQKAKSLQARVVQARNSGQKVVLNSSNAAPNLVTTEQDNNLLGQIGVTKDEDQGFTINYKEKSVETKKPKSVKPPPDKNMPNADQINLIEETLDDQVGSRCCYGLFKATFQKDIEDSIAEILKKTPKYKKREVIKREASHGLEKTIKRR